MTDNQTPDRKTPQSAPRADADRIAKVMARAGVASRREAERMIVEGRVSVNGKKIDSPALDVLPTDRITVDGKKLDEPQETRLWLYYKPLGLITSENDELGRQTVFDALPRELPRVMTVGRLDLNSEGLLLLTNDGELKRRLELPATGWLRRYRVRVNGTPSDMTFDPLRRGVTIEGEDFSPMEIKLDSQQGANAWISVGIREGKNREIRRAMAHVGLQVNRLIRIGYGPFKLTGMEKNQVVEVKRKVLRDQLGGLLTGEVDEKPREMRPRGAEGARGPRRDDRGEAGGRPFAAKPGGRGFGDRPSRPPHEGGRDEARGGDRPARSWGVKSAQPTDRPRPQGKPGDERPRSFEGKPRWKKSEPAEGRRFDGGQGDDGRPARFAGKPGEARKPFGKPRESAAEGDRKPYGKPRPEATERARPSYGKPRPEGAAGGRSAYGKPRPEGAEGGRPSYGKPRPEGAEAGRKPYGKPRADAPGSAGKAHGGGRREGAEAGRKPFAGARGEGADKFQAKPRPTGGGKGFGPRSDRPAGGGPRPGGKPGGKPRAPRS